MAEKDIITKTIESYAEVFADMINVFFFNGEQVVLPEALIPADTFSQYKAFGQLSEQERDVSKFWKNARFNIALIGLENQSRYDPLMPIRIIGYDGADYRYQLKNNQNKKDGHYYPVITLVVYFGKEKWTKGHSLHDCLDIPEELKPLVSDYKINVVDMNHITHDEVEKFRSDFKVIAEYYEALNSDKDYVPSDRVLDHPQEIADFFSVFRNDNRFLDAYNEMNQKGEVTMCELLDRYIEQGRREGRAEEKENAIRNTIKLCRKFKASVTETISELITSYDLSEDSASQKVEQYWNVV